MFYKFRVYFLGLLLLGVFLYACTPTEQEVVAPTGVAGNQHLRADTAAGRFWQYQGQNTYLTRVVSSFRRSDRGALFRDLNQHEQGGPVWDAGLLLVLREQPTLLVPVATGDGQRTGAILLVTHDAQARRYRYSVLYRKGLSQSPSPLLSRAEWRAFFLAFDKDVFHRPNKTKGLKRTPISAAQTSANKNQTQAQAGSTASMNSSYCYPVSHYICTEGTVCAGEGCEGGNSTTYCYWETTYECDPTGDPDPTEPCSDPCACYGEGCSDPPTPPATDPTPPATDPPCATMNALATEQGFQGLMENLKDKTGNPQEEGYTFTKTGNSITNAVQYSGDPGTGQINLTPNAPIDGYMHTHYAGLLSIFSGTDLKAIYELYNQNSIKDVNTFTAEVVTANGTTYAITITDAAALKTFGDRWFADPVGWQVFEGLFYDNRYNIKTTNSNEQNERGFLQLLAGSNIGLSLLKGNVNDFSAWSKLQLNAAGNPSTSPCQ